MIATMAQTRNHGLSPFLLIGLAVLVSAIIAILAVNMTMPQVSHFEPKGELNAPHGDVHAEWILTWTTADDGCSMKLQFWLRGFETPNEFEEKVPGPCAETGLETFLEKLIASWNTGGFKDKLDAWKNILEQVRGLK